MNPEIWPYRVGVRHFKPPRRSQGMSWQHQSQQSGGNVQHSDSNGNLGNNRPQQLQCNQVQLQNQGNHELSQIQSNHSKIGSKNEAPLGNPSFSIELQNKFGVLAESTEQECEVFNTN